MKSSVVTFAQLPEDEAAFLAYLAKSGDIWARSVADTSVCDPAPVAQFIAANHAALKDNGVMNMYIGFRPDVVDPAVPGTCGVDIFAAQLIGYTRGGYYPSGELAQSNLYFYRGSFQGDEFLSKSEIFLKWADKVLGWARRHSPNQVPVFRCNYKTRATSRVMRATADGLKVWY